MINQIVHVPTMDNDLLCPMQMRLKDIDLNECPEFMESRPNDWSHTLRATQDGEELIIPLAIRGVTSCFPTRKPTKAELATCMRFDLTSEDPEWDPQSIAYQEQEEATGVDAYGLVHETAGDQTNRRYISTVKVSRDQASEFDNWPARCLKHILPSDYGMTVSSSKVS